jgi:hypothetical protein
MEVPNTVAITGIIVSLTIFFLLLRRAASLQELGQANDDDCFSPNTPVTKAAPRLGSVGHTSIGRSDIKLVAISHDRGCQERLNEMAEFYGWELFLCSNCKVAESVLRTESVPIVLCDRDTLGIYWRDAFRIFLRSDRSRCVVLFSNADDDYLWQDVIRCGGYDVVHKPLQEEQVVRTVKFAWSFWKTLHISAVQLGAEKGGRPPARGRGSENRR